MDGAIVILLFLSLTVLISYFVAKIGEKKKKSSTSESDNNREEATEDDSGEDDDSSMEEPENEDRKKIDGEIADVDKWIGLNDCVNTAEMHDLLMDGQEEKVANLIGDELRLPMKINLIKSNKVLKDGDYAMLGGVRVGNLPNYGSDNLKRYTCNITVYPGYNTTPDRFIHVIAHEICHYVLQTLRRPLQDREREERLTDIAVILSGFGNSYARGKKTSNGEAGYLSEDEMKYVQEFHRENLKKRKETFEKLKKRASTIKENSKDKIVFCRMMDAIMNNPKAIQTKEEIEAFNKCLLVINQHEVKKILKTIEDLNGLNNKVRYGRTDELEEQVEETEKLLNGIFLPSPEDINTIAKLL